MESPYNTDKKALELVGSIFSQVLDKIAGITIAINEVTNQIKNLSALTSQSPTRQDISNKINDLNKIIDDTIKSDIVEVFEEQHEEILKTNLSNFEKLSDRLTLREKEHILMNQKFEEIDKKIEVIQKIIVDVAKDAKDTYRLFKLTIKIVMGFLFTVIPVLFTLFAWLNKLSDQVMKIN